MTGLALVASDERPHTALIHPVLDAAGVMAVHNAIAKLVQETLVDGKDYGVIPGTNKPSLYKSGAERLCVGFGLVDTYEIIESEVDHNFENAWEKRDKKGNIYKSGTALGLYTYTVKCLLRRREDNQLVAEGIGSCSSLESKYCDRPRDVANTVLKMAKKRAKVDATLSGLGLSDRFTQDVEDLDRSVEDEHGNATERPTGGEVKAAKPKEKPAREKRMPMGHSKGKLLGELDTKDLESAAKWCRENNKFPDLVSAIADVLAERQKDQGKLELDALQAGGVAPSDSPVEKKGDPAPTSSGPAREAAPANPQPAGDAASPSNKKGTSSASSACAEKHERPENRARWSAAELQKHALHLLDDPALKEIRRQETALLNGALGHEALISKVVTFEKMIVDTRAVRKAEDDDLPF